MFYCFVLFMSLFSNLCLMLLLLPKFFVFNAVAGFFLATYFAVCYFFWFWSVCLFIFSGYMPSLIDVIKYYFDAVSGSNPFMIINNITVADYFVSNVLFFVCFCVVWFHISSFFSTHLCALLGGVALLLWYYYVLTLSLFMFFPIMYTVSIIFYFVHSPILDWYLTN